MDVICAPSGFIGLECPQNGILTIKQGGFDKILLDMAMSCSAWELETFGRIKKEAYIREKERKRRIKISEHPEELSDSFGPLLEQCRKHQMVMLIARAPYLLWNTERDDLEELLSSLAKESIRLCGEAGCQYLVVRSLFAGIKCGNEWEVNRNYYLGLVDEAEKNNVTILLENQCRDINGHLVRGICADADEAVVWVDQLNQAVGEERFGFCMDVGVCNLCGQDMHEFATTLGSRIKAVILRDCDGHYEASMLPFTYVNHNRSATDWQGFIRGLREIDFDGLLIMDFSSTTAAFSPLLRLHLLPFAKAAADYFKWQISMKLTLKKYDTRVLFGAGNMCRNYMKCYGKKFPPLFTCDNDKNRWGEQFEGLEIKPPEALKVLPPNCAIFICNIYYKEIAQQLRDMGIPNPIEYFSDEYMPSYYFDRLEYWKGE